MHRRAGVMELLAAVDVRAGAAVRLVQGDFDRQQDYGDPREMAARLVAGGARWLHVVDLDAARTGQPANRAVVEAIVGASAVPVQVGGGVRTEADVAALLGAGAARVVLGTAALADPGFACAMAARHPGRVALGLDYRRRADGTPEAAGHGWEDASGRTVAELLGLVAGAPLGAVVVTAIDRDGTLSGPDVDGLAAVLAATGHAVVASGGVGGLADLRALAALRDAGSGRGLAGVVVGKALADGRLEVAEAVAACATSG